MEAEPSVGATYPLSLAICSSSLVATAAPLVGSLQQSQGYSFDVGPWEMQQTGPSSWAVNKFFWLGLHSSLVPTASTRCFLQHCCRPRFTEVVHFPGLIA